KSDVPEQIMPPIVGGYGAGWQATRRAVLRRDKYRCTVCGRRNNLHIHHVGLKAGTPGAENLDNLTTLCGQCHNRVHGKKSMNSEVA
ncbi:MAG: HNH endonuclease, partial [Anaerolineales bacterium]